MSAIPQETTDYQLMRKFSSNILSEVRVQTNQSKSLNTMDIDHALLNSTFDIDEFEKVDCSYLKYSGGIHLERGYVCSQCNPTKNLIMCAYCYSQCHKDCAKNKNDELDKPSYFTCYCGEKLKHKKPKQGAKSFKPCKMINFDKIIGHKNHYFCAKHNVKICSVCAKECHSTCDNVLPINEDVLGCECSDKNNHNDYNEFTFNFARVQTGKGKDFIMKDLWPIQVLNILFETKIYRKLEYFVKEQLDSAKTGKSKFPAPFPRIIGLFSDTFNKKFKTFYYHEEIMQLFKYQSLVQFIKKIDTSSTGAKLLKFRMLFLILFLHLKKDFQLLKSYTSIDFISGSLLERLIYRKYMHTKSIYTEEILEKYKILNENHPNYINTIALKEVCEFMRDAICGDLPIEENKYEFEIGFKFLCFLCKRMLLGKKEIEKITDDLYLIQVKILEVIERDNSKINELSDIFKGLVELCLLLAVNYNDIAIYDYLTSSKKTKFNINDQMSQFIHSKCEAGENIFKMVIKNSKIIKKHYIKEDGTKFYFKILNTFDSCFDLFSLVDNFYYNQIKNITEEELEQFYERIAKLDNNKESFPDLLKEIEDKSDDRESGQERLLNFNKHRVIPLSHNDSILESKMSIEIFLNTYFTAAYNKRSEIFYSISQEIENFVKRINTAINNTAALYENKIELPNYASIQEKVQSDYIKKVTTSLSRFFYSIRKLHIEQIEKFIDSFIFSNLDETIFKVLIIFSTGRYVNQITFESLDLCLSFLSFFFLSKVGMRYFLTGKNITRMHKLFNRFRFKEENKNINNELNRSKQTNMRFTTRILEFIFLVAKGVDTFQLQLSNHKVLDRFIEHFILHLQLYSRQKDIDKETGFKIHLSLITSIFLCFKHMYPLEDFEMIKRSIWDIFKDTGLMPHMKANFLDGFVREVDDMGRVLEDKKETILINKNSIYNKLEVIDDSNSEFSQMPLIEDPFHTYIISETDPSKNFELNENLYCNFFRMMCFRTYYTYTKNVDEYFIMAPSMDNLDKFKAQLSNYNLSLKIRREFINYIRTVFFSEYLDINDIKKYETALTTAEFIEFEKTKKYSEKYERLQKQEKCLDLFIQELTMFPKQVVNYGDNVEVVEGYIIDLLRTIKLIANFYYNEKKIWCRSVVTFYNLAKELSLSMPLLKSTYSTLVNEVKFTLYSSEDFGMNKYYLKLRRRKFDIMDKNQLYSIVTIIIKEILSGTKADQYASLESFLKEYDTLKDYNFSPPSFIETNDFEFFYTESSEEKAEETPCAQKIKAIQMFYTEQFVNVENTNFLEIISGIFDESDQVDYRKEIMNYFVLYMQYDNYKCNNLYSILCIVNKMLFYDSSGSRGDIKFLKEQQYNNFFKQYNFILHKMLIHTYSTCRNIFVPDLFLLYSNITKLLLQFLQLLGDGFDKTFNPIIFTLFKYDDPFKGQDKDDTKKPTPRDTKKNSLKPQQVTKKKHHGRNSMRISSTANEVISDLVNGSMLDMQAQNMPFYTFIVRNLMDAYQYLNLPEQMQFEMPFDKLIVLCNNLIDFITEYIDVNEEYGDVVNGNIERLFSINVFKCLLQKSDIKNKLRSDLICFMKSKFLNLVISYFQKGKLKAQIRRFTKLLSPSQIFEEILHHMQALFVFMKFPSTLPLYSDKKFVSTLLNHYIYNSDFRNSLQLNLCLQYFILIKFYEETYTITTLKEHINKISTLPEVQKEYYGLNTKFAYKIRTFFEELVLKVDIKRIQGKNVVDNIETFFVRPHITYHLSSQTKENFELNVDRTSTSSKLNELLFYSDYFSFEMATNARLLGKSFWSQFMRRILFQYIELISYLLLIIHNVIMVVINYKDVKVPEDEYNELDTDELYEYDSPNLILAIIQLLFLVATLAIWFYYKFPLAYEKHLLRKTGKKFIFKKVDNEEEKEKMQTIKDYFDNTKENISVMETINELNQSTSRFNRIYIGVVDAFLANREICILFYTLIFLIIYLSTACIIWLAIPLLFLFNAIPTLYNVYSAVRDHIVPLLAIVLLIYIFCYNFMWISFHFMSDLFYLEVLDYETGNTIEESFCTSSIQCLLHIIEYFVVGTAPDTSYVSYRKNPNFYVTNFFYDLFFFVIVSLVMYNVFLGVLYDTFSELRGNLQEKENDINNVCFICQLTRDGSLAKRIDFNEHVRSKHYMWNYVYFMIYLHISNANDFDAIQNYVWEKLILQDNSWIPNDNDS